MTIVDLRSDWISGWPGDGSCSGACWMRYHSGSIQISATQRAGPGVVGSTDPGRVAELAAAARISLNKTEWYALYRAAGNRLP